jgi:hypothetical protein
MRRLALACFTCLACTRLNPAFDDAKQTGESGADAVGDTQHDSSEGSNDDSSDEAETDETDTDETSDTGLDDLPDAPACGHQPSSGLAIKLGQPSNFGGGCPNSYGAWAKIGAGVEGQGELVVCSQPGCDGGCTTQHSVSAFPLIITDHLPDSACVMVQAETLLGLEPSACWWGSLSIVSPFNNTPYVIATTHSSPLTPNGNQALAGLIPEPVKAESCNCDDIGQGNNCCYQAGPPAFYYYPFEGTNVFPGEMIQLPLANQPATDHYFRLYQAQRIYSCEQPDLELSWAVVAKL